MNRFPEHIENNQSPPPQTEPDFDVRALLFAFLRNWYWILLCVLVGLAAARLYLRYTVPVYQAKGTILIKGDPNSSGGSGMLSEEAVLQELGVMMPNTNVLNEIQILQSRSLMEEVVRELGLNIRYIGEGRIRDSELYDNTPVVLDTLGWGGMKQLANLRIAMLNDRQFELYQEESDEKTDRKSTRLNSSHYS